MGSLMRSIRKRMEKLFGGGGRRRRRGFSRFQVDSARPAAGMLMVMTFEVVAFVLGTATGTGAEAGLTAGTAVVWGVTAESVCKGAKELAV